MLALRSALRTDASAAVGAAQLLPPVSRGWHPEQSGRTQLPGVAPNQDRPREIKRVTGWTA
jgi:hypothetical protein